MPSLRVEGEPESSARALPAKGEFLLGRHPESGLVVLDPSVSRRHAAIEKRGAAWELRDLGSAHGTFLNGERVTHARLAHGDRIALGQTILLFDLKEEGKRSSAPAPAKAKAPRRPAETGPLRPVTPREETIREPEVLEAHRADQRELIRAVKRVESLELADIVRSGAGGEREPTGTGELAIFDSDKSALVALVRIGEGLRRARSVDEVSARAVEMAMRATSADRGAIAVRGPEEASSMVVRAQRVRRKGKLVDEGSVRVSTTIADRVQREKVALLLRDVPADPALAKSHSVEAAGVRSALALPLQDGEEVLGWLYLDRNAIGASAFATRDLDVACLLGFQAAAEIARLRALDSLAAERERRRTLARFFSSDVIRHLEEDAAGGTIAPAKAQTVTVLFCDLAGFTAMSEGVEPEALKEMVDVYFDRMTEILVDRHGATLDKYVGDGIMALFGAPYSRGERTDAREAVAAAWEMMEAFARLRDEVPFFRELGMRIGVNAGRVVAGMMGSRRRLEYSVLGDAVNVASRLESTSEPGRIQIGESVHAAVRDVFECEPAGERQVKNRAKPVRCWWVNGPK